MLFLIFIVEDGVCWDDYDYDGSFDLSELESMRDEAYRMADNMLGNMSYDALKENYCHYNATFMKYRVSPPSTSCSLRLPLYCVRSLWHFLRHVYTQSACFSLVCLLFRLILLDFAMC